MNLICWAIGHSWRPFWQAALGKDFNECYKCNRCGKVETE